jgi:predicted dehydrogenase
LRTAIIGAGRMGQCHAAALRQLGLELVGVCDCRPEAMAAFAAENGVSPDCLFTDPDRLLGQTRPECVIVATHAPSHADFTCRAAAAGARFILCEKPMAVSLEQCDRMIDACSRHGTRLAVNHQMRFMPQYQQPKHIVYSECFGGLSSITVLAGNFGLAMNGTHYFEMFRYLTDEAPDQVSAWFSQSAVPNPRGANFQDKAGSVRVTTPQGRRLYLEVGADQGHGVKVIYCGPYGQLIVDELHGTMCLGVREASQRALPTTRYGLPELQRQLHIEPVELIQSTRLLLEALVRGGDVPTGSEGRQAVEVLVAAHVSDESGHVPVNLPNALLPRARAFPWA